MPERENPQLKVDTRQRCDMFRDYTAASFKMKSNYSKLYDITAVPQNVHGYVMPLTIAKGLVKTFLQI